MSAVSAALACQSAASAKNSLRTRGLASAALITVTMKPSCRLRRISSAQRSGAKLVTWVLSRNKRRIPAAKSQSPKSVTRAIRVCGCRASVPGQRCEWPSEQP